MLNEIIAFIALAAMEIVLGIDNVVFISIVSSRLPEEQQPLARRVGLLAAMIMRILLLFLVSVIMGLTEPIFSLTQIPWWPADWLEWLAEHEEVNEFSWKDLILLGGGLFLIRSSVIEIHNKIEGSHDEHLGPAKATFSSVIIQIALLDIVFSLDSVITAVGMSDNIWVMVAAVIVAIGVMMIFAGTVSEFVERHPTVKMLALSFLLLIGVMLVAEGVGSHINKGYIYFAMAFSLGVEALNLWTKSASNKQEKAAH
jgi:predicted tellurium resistance membrane protein TerC